MSIIDNLMQSVARAVVGTRAMSRPVAFTSQRPQSLMLDASARGWSNSAVAYRCVNAISTNASSLPLQIIDSEGVERTDEHPLGALWQRPNPLLSSRIFGEYLWGRLETRGETFVYVDRGDSGEDEPSALWPIFGSVELVVDKTIAGEVLGFRVTVAGGKRVFLLPSEVLWLRYPDPDSEWGVLAPLTAAAHALSLDAHARAWQEHEFENGARMSAVVYLGDLDEEQHDAVVAEYRARVEGAENAGRTLFVSSASAAKVERMQMTPDEMSWLDTRRHGAEEVMLAWGVPRDYLMGGATYENRAASRATLWSDTIIPKLEIVASEMTRQLLADTPGWRVRFDTDDVDALRESEDAKFERAREASYADILLLDEIRASLGYDPLPNNLGAMTLTAYRARVQAEAQAALLAATGQGELPPVRTGALEAAGDPQPLALPAGPIKRTAGLSFDDAQRIYDRHERIGARAVRRLASKQERAVVNNLHRIFGRNGQWASKRDALLEAVRLHVDAVRQQTEPPSLRENVDDLMDEAWARQMTAEELQSYMEDVWVHGGSLTGGALGLNFDTFEPRVLDEMNARLTVLSDQVTATTRRVLEERVLLEGVANGESVDQLAARVRATFTDLSTWRARMIARTETVGGFNAASMHTARDSGVVKAREWLATADRRTRDSHIAVHGTQVTDWEQRYMNGCLHPGDPTAPADETIMCRCVETYVTD